VRQKQNPRPRARGHDGQQTGQTFPQPVGQLGVLPRRVRWIEHLAGNNRFFGSINNRSSEKWSGKFSDDLFMLINLIWNLEIVFDEM